MGKRGQVWVETVIYTLIGLAIIGLLLSIVKPAIERKQDEILIESSLEMLNYIENSIDGLKERAPGNTWVLDLKIKKGKLEILSAEDKIKFTIKTKHMYSEPGQLVEIGRITRLTEEKTKKTYDVSLSLDYQGSLDLTWNNANTVQTFQPSSVPYSISITNKGIKENADLLQIDFS